MEDIYILEEGYIIWVLVLRGIFRTGFLLFEFSSICVNIRKILGSDSLLKSVLLNMLTG